MSMRASSCVDEPGQLLNVLVFELNTRVDV